MSTNSSIGKPGFPLKKLRFSLETGTINSIREALPDRMIERACEEAGYKYRKRLLTPVVVILHMLLAAIWPEESFAASWQLMWDAAVGRFPCAQGKSPSSGSVAKARARIPLAVWRNLFERISRKDCTFAGL